MIRTWTEERLGELTAVDRHRLWSNANTANTDAGRNLAGLIEQSGLSFLNPKGLELDSPTGRALYKVIFSQDSKDAGAKATDEGRPALADIEPLIVAELGASYADQHEATVQAGYLVRKMMEINGFERTGKKGSMPVGSVAKTAERYKRKT